MEETGPESQQVGPEPKRATLLEDQVRLPYPVQAAPAADLTTPRPPFLVASAVKSGAARRWCSPQPSRPAGDGPSTPRSNAGDMGVLLRFPVRTVGTFTSEMRVSLACLAAQLPLTCPMVFGVAEDGSETCRLANGFVIGWSRRRCLFVGDTRSGFVDHGPFDSMAEVCRLVAYLEA